MRLRPIAIFLSMLVAAGARASCGSSSCPLDTRALNLPLRNEWTVDLSLQYVDQDQPRIGTRNAQVGEIENEHHDEVRTLNRIATALISYAPTDRLSLSVAVPYVSRDHFHLASSHHHIESQHNIIPQSWELRGVGDVVLEARAAVTRSGLWAIGGVKLPTGKHDARNASGLVGELPVQPGTGSTDGILGLAFQGGSIGRSGVSGPAGNYGVIPYFASLTYQFRTGDVEIGRAHV